MANLATLSVVGWISDLASRADYVMSCFLTTNTSMTVLHRTQNTSLQYILKEKANDPSGLEIRLTEILLSKLQIVFGATAIADVQVIVPDPERPDEYSIRFTGTVYDNNKPYSFGRVVQFKESRIVNIATINNG